MSITARFNETCLPSGDNPEKIIFTRHSKIDKAARYEVSSGKEE
jgi:hypothetical protein